MSSSTLAVAGGSVRSSYGQQYGYLVGLCLGGIAMATALALAGGYDLPSVALTLAFLLLLIAFLLSWLLARS